MGHHCDSGGVSMTNKLRTPNTVVIFAASVAALFLAGCAGMASSNTESLLTAAGFRARTPQTPKQQQIYAALPPYQVQRATVNGKVFYVYKDEKAGVAYVGREQEYQSLSTARYPATDSSKPNCCGGNGAASCPRLVRRIWFQAPLVVKETRQWQWRVTVSKI